MHTIRDLVAALRQREGVDATVVLGRDGLVIDSHVAAGADADSLAALAPAIVTAAEEFGERASHGALTTAILEYPETIAVISALTPDALLLVLARPSANVGALLYELRRHREQIAALV
ncbi:MAG: roadblock/LC7 domain-containing protein [Gemmatimonadaceae bacterium]